MNAYLLLYLFSITGKNADIIRFIKELFNSYRPKLFPYFKNIDSDFMKLISRYRSEKP